jgi:predicted N-formylglutamate amidohydrolase
MTTMTTMTTMTQAPTTQTAPTLLHPDEPAPVALLNPHGGADILLVCDHAGQRVPRALNGLGISPAALDRHIGWDIGAGGVTRALAASLDASAILQLYSRLVIDCNRRPGHPTSVAAISDGTLIPANAGIPPGPSAPWHAEREAEIFAPYHDAIARHLDRQLAAGRRPAIIAVHSFTPAMDGIARPWQAGVLHNHDPRLALATASLLRREGLTVGDNEPYALSDDSDYTIPVHAEQRGLLNLELEIRQDLIAEPAQQAEWAALLARIIPAALAGIG